MSFLGHAGIEIAYIKYALAKGTALVNNSLFGRGYCVLPEWLQIGLIAAGAALGFWLGVKWWRIIYVEKRFAPWYRRR